MYILYIHTIHGYNIIIKNRVVVQRGKNLLNYASIPIINPIVKHTMQATATATTATHGAVITDAIRADGHGHNGHENEKNGDNWLLVALGTLPRCAAFTGLLVVL